eukprot:Colp12_sorted_trinity150504_noHs@31519
MTNFLKTIVLLAAISCAFGQYVAEITLIFSDTDHNGTDSVERFEGIYATYGPSVPFTGTPLAVTPRVGCMPMTPVFTGNETVLPVPWIAIVERGNCRFYDKSVLAKAAGASAVIVVNQQEGDPVIAKADVINYNGIPTVSVSLPVGQRLLAAGNKTVVVIVGDQFKPVLQFFVSKLFYDVAIFFIVFCGATTLVAAAYYLYRRRQVNQASRLKRARQDEIADFLKSLPIKTFVKAERMAAGEDSNAMCAICLDEFDDGVQLRALQCRHEFHVTCIDPWLLEHHTCPLCKIDVVTGEPASVPSPRVAPEGARTNDPLNPMGGTHSTVVNVVEYVELSHVPLSVSGPAGSTVVGEVVVGPTEQVEVEVSPEDEEQEGGVGAGLAVVARDQSSCETVELGVEDQTEQDSKQARSTSVEV